MKTYGGMKIQFRILNLMPWPVYPLGKNLSFHQKEGWVDPRASLGMVVGRKNPRPCQELNPSSSLVDMTEVPQLLPFPQGGETRIECLFMHAWIISMEFTVAL
jgi:hypothetical protein